MPRIIFGITGSISAYKALDVLRLLRQSKVDIIPILTVSAQRFITHWTVETLAESRCLDRIQADGEIPHLICRHSDAFIVCPASANMIAKLRAGIADDMLSAAFLSHNGPTIICPAMHSEMYLNPITQSNIQALTQQGIHVIPPAYGQLACGDTGIGRLPDQPLIHDVIMSCLHEPLQLDGQRIVITCGGTREPIDSVRCITNKGTGISGHVMANVAAFYGASVTLIRTSKHPVLSTIDTVDVDTAHDMRDALLPLASTCNRLIMNAAVSDFSIETRSTKQHRSTPKPLHIQPTQDILATFNSIKPKTCRSVGFCLQDTSDNIIQIAQEKRAKKQCDVIIANDTTSFGANHRSVYVISDRVTHYNNVSLVELARLVLTS